jgi:hypothetical protein
MDTSYQSSNFILKKVLSFPKNIYMHERIEVKKSTIAIFDISYVIVYMYRRPKYFDVFYGKIF